MSNIVHGWLAMPVFYANQAMFCPQEIKQSPNNQQDKGKPPVIDSPYYSNQ
jgi:hypothetical protein